MILRRVIKHVRGQEWTAIVIDFLIVVVGVFVGLQVSNWNDARTVLVEERVLLSRLEADYAVIVQESASKAEHLSVNIKRTEQIAAAIRAPELVLETTLLRDYIARVFALPGTVEHSATYVELVSGGAMLHISDNVLRAELMRHDNMLLDAKETQDARRNFVRTYVVPLYRFSALLEEMPAPEALERAGGRYEILIALKAIGDISLGEHERFKVLEEETRRLASMLQADQKEKNK